MDHSHRRWQGGRSWILAGREEDEFRQEIRDFLKAELPQGWNDTLVLDKESEEYIEGSKDFTQRVGAKGWLAAHWPPEYGESGLVLLAVLHHE